MRATFLVILFCFVSCQTFAQEHWHSVHSGTSFDLYSISFANEKTGYIGGEDGLLLKTNDSGNSWQVLQPIGFDTNVATRNIIDLQFLDNLHGYALLNTFPVHTYSAGWLYQTDDGGQNWYPVNDSINITRTRCFFLTRNNGFLLGAAYFAGNVIGKMQNGLWTEYFNFSFNPSQFNYGIDFRDTLTGIVGGDGGYFYRTFDGGQSWDTVYGGNDSTIYAIKYLNDSAIIAATGHGNRSLIISYDSGATWLTVPNSAVTFAYPVMKALAVAAGDSIVAVGHTTNPMMSPAGAVYWFDGSEWHIQSFRQNLYDVVKQSSSSAFAVGDSGLIVTNRQMATGIFDKDDISGGISISPNPAKNIINLQYNDLHIQSLKLTDVSGRTVKSFPAKSKRLNVSGVAAGLYFFQVKANEGEMTEKVEIK